MLNIINR